MFDEREIPDEKQKVDLLMQEEVKVNLNDIDIRNFDNEFALSEKRSQIVFKSNVIKNFKQGRDR